MESSLSYKIALALVPGIGGVLARNLLEYCGNAEQIFSESLKSLMKIPGIGEVNARRIKNVKVFDLVEKELKFINKYKIDVLFYSDDNYPGRLKSCPDAPIILFSKGSMHLNCKKVISIVGTRNATDYGKLICEKLIRDFSKRDCSVLIVSGLAYGIDIHAHKWALKLNIPTVGVLGHGLDKLYPSLHSDIARKMLLNGGLVTDFPSGTRIDPNNFIRRNRIIAGLSDATIVIESAEKGGALITADIAFSYNRDVFAFPGRINDIYSRGCNRLIFRNGASLIQGIEDLEYFMGWDNIAIKKSCDIEKLSDLAPDERRIVELLGKKEKLLIDQISSTVKLPVSKVSNILMNLEIKNILTVLPGNMYKLR